MPVGVGLPIGGALLPFAGSTQWQWASHSVRVVCAEFVFAGAMPGSAASQRAMQSLMRCRHSLLTVVAHADDRRSRQTRAARVTGALTLTNRAWPSPPHSQTGVNRYVSCSRLVHAPRSPTQDECD